MCTDDFADLSLIKQAVRVFSEAQEETEPVADEILVMCQSAEKANTF